MRLSEISFLSEAEKIVMKCNDIRSNILSFTITRLAAFILLTPASALDIGFHALCILPTCCFAIGKSIYMCKLDFTIPWQHLQRVQNAVAPLVFGSAFGIIFSIAAIAVSEATDKHAVIGMLSSNAGYKFQTPCSPIHSLSIIERIALNYSTVEVDGKRETLFSKEHIEAIQSAKSFEKSLESLQAQEFIYKITNITLFVMAKIKANVENSRFQKFPQQVLLRGSGLLIPVLSVVDASIAILLQAFFLTTGIVRLISGRGPAYTEVTTNPLMHVTFLIQNILKLVGNLVGTAVWLISPMDGFKVSLLPANLFFKLQVNFLMFQIKFNMWNAKDNSKFVIPVAFGNGSAEVLALPSQNMHMTYLIVEKKQGVFNLIWVNRPNIFSKSGLSEESALTQIRSMLDERFPFMDMNKLFSYPVQSSVPKFPDAQQSSIIYNQGNNTNCAVSNAFGMLEALDKMKGVDEKLTKLRYQAIREALMKEYSFYKNDFHPFLPSRYSLSDISYNFNQATSMPI